MTQPNATGEPRARYRDLAEKTVFVSGGATGIGADLVTAFAHQGATVAFVDLDAEAGEALRTRLEAQTGARLAFTRVDVTDTAALVAAIDAAAGHQGRLDVLVNNAANDRRAAVETVGPADWDAAMAVNLKHQFFAAQAAHRHMKPRRAGSILNLGSTSYKLGVPDLTAYATAKSAVRGLTRQLAREWGRDLVRVNAIVPGAILTEKQLALWISPEKEREILAQQCLPRRLVGSDVAEMALFLASDVSSACTGQDFVVDGGLT
ncbi:SDR family NAD(P)-dependent oxidoreductase [Salinarimonas ramus]|uniref:3-oxoacyl-ACP reductase n=1 Tax=Salinarimonas ramus TaxID=690164 RepID=A0A917Q511_9HYPH|nr:SDR family oxidoreductase [Salinarimonas ramus]GGK24184.1 3-oxoacyl-ACP reductase [Salinarimonas ramus]